MATILSSRKQYEPTPVNSIAGPRESPVGSGPGITEKAGPYADRVVNLASNPHFVGFATKTQEYVRRKNRELDAAGARGKFTGAAGMSKGGEMQFVGAMDSRLYKVLLWTDPDLFNDEERLMSTLRKMGTAASDKR